MTDYYYLVVTNSHRTWAECWPWRRLRPGYRGASNKHGRDAVTSRVCRGQKPVGQYKPEGIGHKQMHAEGRHLSLTEGIRKVTPQLTKQRGQGARHRRHASPERLWFLSI